MKRIVKSVIMAGSLLSSVFFTGIANATPNTSTYSMQLSGNTVSVYETSTEAVNTVEADFTYSDSTNALQSVGVALGSTFTTCTSSSSASVVCTALGGNITGTHLVASLTLNLKSGVNSANIKVGMSGSSVILSSTDNTDTLNHSALPAATYTYTAPTQPSQGGSTGSTNSGNSSSSSNSTNSNPTTSTGNQKTSSTSSATTNSNNAASNNGNASSSAAAVKGATDTQKDSKKPASTATQFKSHHTSAIITSLTTLVIVAAGVYWLIIHKRAAVTTTGNKLNSKTPKSKLIAKLLKKA